MSSARRDELTATLLSVVESLPQQRKASLLLEHSLSLIESGRFDHQVEDYLATYLKTPGLPQDDVAKALMARGKARKDAAQMLLMRAEQDFRTASTFDPSNREIQAQLRRDRLVRLLDAPASQRAPPEVWDRIARFTPRYFLRTWLFVSSFHREIASRHIFRTLDVYLGEDSDTINRTMDVFDRVKADPVFAGRIKALRLHWSYEGGEMLDLMSRIFRTALPEFKALREFEWIGYPELQADMVQVLLQSHPNLDRLGLIGWHFDAVGVSAFKTLKRFTLRAEDDDGFADMGEVRTVLDANTHTLTHLTLGAYLARTHSWDGAFQSGTIQNLAHLELVDTRISHSVLARVAHAHRLVSLTLHGTLDKPSAATVVFGSDHVIEGRHTFLPHLTNFRFVLVGHDDDIGLFQSVVQFLRRRSRLRRLDLGSCPWELVLKLLPELTGLRVLRVKIAHLSDAAVDALVRALPQEMIALHLSSVVWSKSLHTYAYAFSRFTSLEMIHLRGYSMRRPQPALLSDKEYKLQTADWLASSRHIALTLPSVDYIGWHGEHYVVVRGSSGSGSGSGSGLVLGEEEGGESVVGQEVRKVEDDREPANVELKELPMRRRLDCGKGVDLGSEDANWMERKDVPIDYEMSGSDI